MSGPVVASCEKFAPSTLRSMMNASSLFDASVHDSDTEPDPGVAVRPDGAAGAFGGVVTCNSSE